MESQNHIIFIFLMITAPFSGVSQENPARASENTATRDSVTIAEVLGDVTVTAFRVPYNLANTPAPVHLISPVQLKTGNALTPVEALNQVPGLFMHHGTIS